MRVWTIVEGETFEGYDTRWLYCDGERVADLGLPVSDLAPFIVDACNAAEQGTTIEVGDLWLEDDEGQMRHAQTTTRINKR